MSFQKDVALKATIEDFAKARDDTVRLLEQGLRLCRQARERSEEFVRYGFPHDLIPRQSIKAATREIDERWWRYTFRHTGLARLMDAQATREFEHSLEKETPEFSVENIQNMALSLYQDKDALFLRGIYNVFRHLDSSYRTNDRQRFEVERKCVIRGLFDTWYSYSGKFHISHYKRAWLNDVHRCLCVLADLPYQEYSLESEIQAGMKESSTFENDLIKLRGFKNGNGHLWILDDDVLLRINKCIAEYCGPSIPQAMAS